ncbi:MAG: HD domain-containing protein [bacterium]|nr:HD domain-containing protein [bacterium]
MCPNYLDNDTLLNIDDFLFSTFEKSKKHVILAVDDEQNNLSLIKRTLRLEYDVLFASNGEEALKILEEKGDEISLVVSDQKMPIMEGTELFKRISEKYPDIVKILLTGYSNIDILVEAINECHLFQYIIKPFEPEQLCMIVHSGIEKFEMSTSKTQILRDLSELFYKTIKSIAQALDAKDKYTHGHSMRVTLYSLALAKQLNLNDELLEEIETTGLLHDIGKIAIPEKILLKPGRLTDEEFEVIKTHPELGERLVEGIEKLKVISSWLKSHHEKYDGSGYPEHLKGEEIPLSSRIIAIADTYDAMTSSRSYRSALEHEDAIEEIKKCSGTQFDPKLAEIFVSIADEIEKIKNNPDYYYPIYSYLDKLMNK